MSTLAFINEPILVQVRFLSDGGVQPTAFIWRERAVPIAEWGRWWDETLDGTQWRCYLVRSADGETFDLRYAAATGQWLLHRAWLRDAAAA
jgi:hypothetical protein